MRLVGCSPMLACFVVGMGCATYPTFDSYRRSAAKRRAQSPVRPLQSAVRATEDNVVLEGWPYLFTRSQIRRLRRAGYRFDAGDLKDARRLWIIGFTAPELVQAVEDVARYAAGNRAHLESIAAFRVAGFDPRRYRRYQRSSRTLTGWYNDEIVGGSGVWDLGLGFTIGGLTALTLSAGVLIAAAVAANDCRREQVHDDYLECPSAGTAIISFSFSIIAGVGGLSTLVGGLMLYAGAGKAHRKISSRALEKADATNLRDFKRWRRMIESKRTGATLSLSPLLTRGGGGLTLRLTY